MTTSSFPLSALIFVIALVTVAILPAKLGAQADTCPVTQAPVPAFAPPVGNTTPVAGGFFYGTSKLWVQVRPHQRPLDNFIRQKIVWWSEGYDWTANPHPALTISGRRLDGAAPALSVDKNVDGSYDVNGSYRDDMGSFIMSAVNFPTRGCWEITGKLNGTELKFVVSLE